MFGIGFTNPALWIGVVAFAGPVLVHLLSRRTPRRLLFPTIQFIREAKASQSALYRLRHWILFLLRMGFIALLLLAFLKPILERGTLAEAALGEGARATIVVLDASASMAYAGAGFSPLARAKIAAESIVDHLGAKDAANLIVASAVPKASFDVPALSRYLLKRDIQAVAPGQDRADLDAALRVAVDQLARSKAPRHEIHLISDFQRTNWAAVDFSVVPRNVALSFDSVADEKAGNTALAEVMLRPPRPSLGESVEAVCKVANYRATPRSIPVRLSVGDEAVMERTIDVAPGMTASATFRLSPQRAGFLEGRASIPGDALKADDERFFTLEVADRLQVLALVDEPEDDPSAARRVLLGALDPLGDSGRGPFSIHVLRSSEFDAIAGASAQLAILCGAQPLGAEPAKALLDWIHEGGSLIVFLASPADGANLASLQELSQGALVLPFRVGPPMNGSSAGGAAPALHLAQANFDDPILRKFRDVQDLANINFYQAFRSVRVPDQGEILLRYADGTVAMARKSYGQGALLLCNFSPAPAASDLAKRTVFVPLIHEMVKGMRPQSGAIKSYAVGQNASATIALPQGGVDDLRFEGPLGAAIGATYDMRQTEAAVFFGRTARAGFYRVFSGDRHIGSAAVNVDSRESNLEPLSSDQIQDLARLSRDRVYAASALDADALGRLLEGAPIWPYCLLLAFAFLAAEEALLLVWRR